MKCFAAYGTLLRGNEENKYVETHRLLINTTNEENVFKKLMELFPGTTEVEWHWFELNFDEEQVFYLGGGVY